MIDLITQWFRTAKPEPKPKDFQVQLGVHFEEVAEQVHALVGEDAVAEEARKGLHEELKFMATALKTGSLKLLIKDRKEFLDGGLDQIVTATGTLYMAGMNGVTGIERVNSSNYSKFVDGAAIFDENGKIKKGPNFHKPDLEGLY